MSTQNVIPFGDAYWDYAVEKIFLQQGDVSTIQGIVRPTEAGGISQLTWYSGWPVLHTFGVIFSLTSGIDLLYLNWILPNALALMSFGFLYLLFEKIRVKLNLGKDVVFIALLLYAINPEAIFWQMQYVRQSLALALIAPIMYTLYVLAFEKFDKRYFSILLVLLTTLILAHHVTALTITLFLFIFYVINLVSKQLGHLKQLKTFFSPVEGRSFLVVGLIAFLFTLFWWYKNFNIVFPTIESRFSLFFQSFGIEKVYSQATVSYPSVLTPVWASPVLGFRDLVLYGTAIVGFFFLWRQKSFVQEKFFIIYSIFGFGFILAINVIFRIEPLRIILFMAPFLAFLSGILFSKLKNIFLSGLLFSKVKHISKYFGKIGVFLVLTIVVFSSFLGLWAHSFVPAHLYDSSIDSRDIGEVTPDFIRLKSFFENDINMSQFQDVRADVISRLVYLLEPGDFDKIKSLPVENFDELTQRNTLVCAFNDLNLYLYFGSVWSPIQTSDIESIRFELGAYLDSNFDLIYSDGALSVWAYVKGSG